MNADYIEYSFNLSPAIPGKDILIAELAEHGFEGFVENDNEVLAYIETTKSTPDILDKIEVLKSPDFKIHFSQRIIKNQDWNTQWESSFTSITIEDKCIVRASFHDKSKAKYDIIINPKMAFGTGHHATTFMMLQYLLDIDISERTVLDMGCGTGVLAILADKKGASKIEAIDIDEWCYENTLENIASNKCERIQVHKGDSSLLKNKVYDLILANINRNILLKDLKTYAKCLSKDGTLLLSGFYDKDLDMIKIEANKNNLIYSSHKSKSKWIAAEFKKE